MIQRGIDSIIKGHLQQGFLGDGHQAIAVIDGMDFSKTDPFILLMDDRVDLPGGQPVGGAHPHAGFETVTLVLKGDGKDWHTGSIELMTAGKGIVHTEEITSRTNMHILQLWLVLPPEKRWAPPFWQQILLENVPTIKSGQSEIRVYSGSSNGLTSPLKNQAAFTLVDFMLKENAIAEQQLPADYNGFIYVLEGSVFVGNKEIQPMQTAWLEKPAATGETEIRFQAGANGARFILYAGEPQRAPIVSHGPFIGNSEEDIRRLYREYRTGQIPHLNDLPASSRMVHELD